MGEPKKRKKVTVANLEDRLARLQVRVEIEKAKKKLKKIKRG